MRGGTRKIRDIKTLTQTTAGVSSGAGDVIQMEEMGTSGFLKNCLLSVKVLFLKH